MPRSCSTTRRCAPPISASETRRAFFNCIKLFAADARDNERPFINCTREAMKIRHSIIALLAALFACGLQAQDSKPADNTPKLASGLLMKQGDKLVFAPCRDRSYAMVEDISPERVVTRALNSVGLEAGKKLYVELMAVIEGGMIKASGLNLARTEGRCQQPGGNEESWRAAGNEPGWLLAVGPKWWCSSVWASRMSMCRRRADRSRGRRRALRGRTEASGWQGAFREQGLPRHDGRCGFRVDGDGRDRTARRSRAAPGSADPLCRTPMVLTRGHCLRGAVDGRKGPKIRWSRR